MRSRDIRKPIVMDLSFGGRFYTKVHDSFRRVIGHALRDAGAQEPDRLALALFAIIVGYTTFYWSKPLDTAERTSVLEVAYAMVERAVRKGKGIVRTVPKTKRAERQIEDNRQ
jgi:hypothetical protein